MLSIRLSRVGRRKSPTYRLLISEKTKDPWGKYLENLGHYNPRTKEFVFKADRIKHWLGHGAQASASVHNLLRKHGLIQAERGRRVVTISKKRAEKIAEKKAAAA